MRKQFNIALFGTNGTGKTTQMLKIASNYLKSNPEKRVLCIVPDDAEQKYDLFDEIKPDVQSLVNFSGVCKITAENKNVFTILYETYKAYRMNGLCVFDDMGVMLNRRPEEVITLLRRRRQMNMDMIWNFHGLTTDIPRSFFPFITHIMLFKTGDDYSDTLKKLQPVKREEFLKVYQRVEERTKTNPYYFEMIKLI